MSDDEENKSGEIDLDFEWNDALADWEDEIDDSAEARSTPMPQNTKEAAPAARPLYKPPSPNETFAKRPPVARAGQPSPKRPVNDLPAIGDEDDDVIESTRIATVPEELIASLIASEKGNERPTKPPPAEAAKAAAPVDLDLDDVDAPLPSRAPAPKPKASAPPAAKSAAPDPFSESDAPDDGIVASFPPPARKSVPTPARDFDADQRTRIAAPVFVEKEAPRPASVPPPLPTKPKSSVPPPVPKPIGLGRIAPPPPKPPVPGARPPAPPVPRVPPPTAGAVPKPGVPKPPMPAIPKPSLPRPAASPLAGVKPAVPKPGGAAAKPEAAAEPSAQRPTGLKHDETTAMGPGAKKLFSLDEPGGAKPSAPLSPAAKTPVPPAAPTPVPPAPQKAVAASMDDVLPAPVTRDLDADLDAMLGDEAPAVERPTPVPAAHEEVAEEVSIGEEQDEEVAIATEEEEEEASFEAGEDEDFESSVEEGEEAEEEDEDWEAIEAAEAAAEAERAAADRGAIAARRSVRSRKPRAESFPMVGDGPEAMKLRQRLLTSLASTRQGGIKARLLVAAAELAEQVGEIDGARELYKRAIDADPTDVVALRALRRDAIAQGAFDDVAELFQQEAQLALAPRERALALTGLAEVHLARREDPRSAERAAGRALELDPSAVSAAILLAEARWAQGKNDEAIDALAKVLDRWHDPRMRASIVLEQARKSERAHDAVRAQELFANAAELDPSALDAWLGLARNAARPDGDPKLAVQALAKLAEHAQGQVKEALLTRASRVATLVGGDPQAGVGLLEQATGVLPLHARAEAAAATNDRPLQLRALSEFASAAGGTDRALALVRMAEVLAADNDLDGADAALRDAALADGSLGTIRVVREVIARRSGDMSRLVEAIEAGGGLSSAARVAQSPDALPRERELLDGAAAEGTALVAVDVLSLDVAAAMGDEAAVDIALRRQADRVPPEQRVGSLVALCERAIGRGDLDEAETLLAEARQLSPGDPLVLRPLGRLAQRRAEGGATDAAALWLEEASIASGERSAAAATEAGRILARAGGDALGAYRRALDAVRGYGPAAWAIKPIATEAGDALTLGEVHDQLGAAAADPTDAAGHIVRSALLRAEADPEAAAGLLGSARDRAPNDAVLASLSLRLAAGAPPKDRAASLAKEAETAAEPLLRALKLEAASAYEDAGEHATAAAIYREVAQQHPDDAVVRIALDRAEIRSGEVARVASRRFAAVKEATSEPNKVLALERLAELDLHERKDPASAVLSLQSILEISPGHLPSLRALQRYFTEHKRRDDLIDIVEKLGEHVEAGPDVVGHIRLARRLRYASPDAPGDVADETLVKLAPRTELDLWLAPRVLAAARARGDEALARLAVKRLAFLLSGQDERASARVRAAELMFSESPEDALELLRGAATSAPQHPVAARVLAELCERAEDWEGAAEAWEAAAQANEVRTQSADLYYRAGRTWQDRVSNNERARAAYEAAAERDVTHEDLFERLRALLETAGERERLAGLYGQRVAAGGDSAQAVDLYVKQAKLYADASDLENAKDALRAALALQPERVDALRNLANLSLEGEDWRGAAEVLIRIARIRKEREELRWVFFTLGDIYDRHMPDPKRAEAAFQRVLKLLPQDVPAMERLAALYQRDNQFQQAAEMLGELARLDVDPESNRKHRLQLAEIYEQLGDARRAEQVIEEARKNAPTDLGVLRALAEFYKRQNAGNAMAMHLNRGVSDFRHAIEADLGDAAAWPGLVEVLGWRGDADAASVAASAALALGIVDVELSKLVDARGAAPGIGAVAANEQLDDLLAPAMLPAPTRAVFRLAGDALEKSLPFDVTAYRAEKIGARDTTIRPIAVEVARWFGLPEPQIFVTSAAPRVCVPVYANPVTLLVGSELIGLTDDREKVFVLVRALKIAQAQLAVVVRAQPQEVIALLGGLVMSYDQNYRVAGVDPAHVAEAARRIGKNMQRKVQGELGPLVFEMAGRPGYEPARLAMAASEWGNRTGLVASGSAPAAFSALAKLSGERELPTDPAARIAMLSRFPEAASLLTFAVSDAHFEARRRAGRR